MSLESSPRGEVDRRNRREAGVMKAVFLLITAIFLFSGGLVGTLSYQGKFNRDYIGSLMGHEGAVEDPSDAETDVEALHDQMQTEPIPAQMPMIALPSPFSSQETRELFDDLGSMREEVRSRLKRVEREEGDLDLVRSEMNRRWDDLTRREEELEEKIKSIDAERHALEARSVVLEEAELRNLKQLGGDIEKMKAPAAAALLMEKTPERVALILSFIKSRESGKILAEMPPEFSNEVTEKALGILRPEDLKKKEN